MRMKKVVGILVVVALLGLLSISTALSIQSIGTSSSGTSCDFIFFSDPHVGQLANFVSGSDNLTSIARYSLLMSKFNGYQTSFIANGGDSITALTMQGNTPILQDWYGQYMNVTRQSTNLLMAIKGNHDFNLTLYTQMVGPLNWAQRFGDIFIVGIGTTIDNGIKTNQSALYNGATNDFLAQAVSSAAYNQTTYHFLFMHYQPNSVYISYTVPQSTLQYLPYFNVVFCGHNAGATYTFKYNGVTCVHVAHLGCSTIQTDEYTTVSINRSTGKITVTAQNFWLGTQRAILT